MESIQSDIGCFEPLFGMDPPWPRSSRRSSSQRSGAQNAGCSQDEGVEVPDLELVDDLKSKVHKIVTYFGTMSTLVAKKYLPRR